MVTYVGQQADLGGGGGVNGIAKSPYESTAIVTNDNAGDACYIDMWPPVWSGARGGIPDGGEAMGGGGLDFTANPAYPRRVWKFYKLGIAVTNELPDDFTSITQAPIYGCCGNRPRPTVGHVGESSFNGGVERVYSVDRGGVVRRWVVGGDQSDPTVGALTTLDTLPGIGEGVSVDPIDPTVLHVATRAGLFTLTNIQGAPSGVGRTAYSNIALAYDVDAVNEGGQTVLYVAAGNDGIRRGVPAGAGTAFANKTGSNMDIASLWCVVKARRQGGVTRLLAGCSAARHVTSPDDHWQTWFYTDNPAASSPTWVDICLLSGLVNDQGDGTPWWGYLSKTMGGAGNTGNPLVTQHSGAEDGAIDPLDWNKFYLVGQQGHWFYDVTTALVYPYLKRLAGSSNWAIEADPNAPGTFYSVNLDHTFWATRDRGYTYRKNENGDLPAPHDAGFCVALESGVTISRAWLGYGERDANTYGRTMFSPDPALTPMVGWRQVGTVPGARRVYGLATRRQLVSGTMRVVGVGMIEGGGIMRGVFTTGSPPTVVNDWAIVNGTPPVDLGAGGQNMHADMFFTTDAIAYGFDGSSGIWITRDNGVAFARLWGVVNNAAGEGFITPDPAGDPGTILVSIGSGANAGLYELSGCEVPGATVENGGVTKRELKRGTTSFTLLGQVRALPDGRTWAPESTLPPRMWYSEDDGATWTNVADDMYRRSVRKMRGIAVDSEGVVAISMAGPGIFTLLPDTIVSPPTTGPQIRIERAYITLPDPSVVNPVPTITSFAPVSGYVGDTVAITGTGFTGATAVRFAGVNAVGYTVDSATQITAAVPAGAATGVIEVVGPGGAASSPDDFTVLEVPVLLAGVDLPSAGNPEASITTRVIGIWLVDRNVGTDADPAARVRMLDQEDIPAAIGESSEVLYPIGRPRPVRITDAIRGYEGTVTGYVAGRPDRLQIEQWKADGAELRLVAGDLNIPVQMGKLSIARIADERGAYEVTIEVEQIAEFFE